MKRLRNQFKGIPLVLCVLALPASTYAEDSPQLFEDTATSEAEYLRLEEILTDDSATPSDSGGGNLEDVPDSRVAVPDLESQAESDREFVDLNRILYGTEPANEEQGRTVSLPQEIEALKSKVLETNQALFVLEEELLFPANTQVNVFVSYDSFEYFQLDGVTIKVNEDPVATHLYTEHELRALDRGAIQRLYTGNLSVGEHELVAIITGVGPEGRDYKRAVSLDFRKNNGPKYIELQVEGDNLRKRPGFRLKQWE